MPENKYEEILLHDVKNFLTGISASAGLFIDGYLGTLNEAQMNAIETINRANSKLIRILTDYQDLASLENKSYLLKSDSFTIGDLLKNMDWIIKSAKKEKKDIKIEADYGSKIFADKDLISRILENLLLNAIKQSKREAETTLKISIKKDQAVFEVINPTEELPKEGLEKIFDKDFKIAFPKMKSMIASGHGFYFCRLAVEAQAGKISVNNENGVRYSFILPQKG
ncbi:MAG: HAMP domain-containing sensor histidine kinase [Candidatus Margulisiibacteriota bacterium]